jgi:hypothetical protein
MFSINLLVNSLTTTTSSKIALHGCALLTAYPLALLSHALHGWYTGWSTQTSPLDSILWPCEGQAWQRSACPLAQSGGTHWELQKCLSLSSRFCQVNPA